MKVTKEPLRQKRRRRADWINNHFEGEDVFIVGGGPSLSGFDFSRLDDKNVVAVNHAYMYVRADVLVFLDASFLGIVRDRGHRLKDWPFKIIAGPSSNMQHDEQTTIIVYEPDKPTMSDPSQLYGRASSALVALNAALYMTSARIFLLGIDCCFQDGRGHFFSDQWAHPRDSSNHEPSYMRMAEKFNKFSRFKNVYNCSPISRVNTFRYMDIEDAL